MNPQPRKTIRTGEGTAKLYSAHARHRRYRRPVGHFHDGDDGGLRPRDTDLDALRARLAPHPVVLTDTPTPHRDPFGIPDGPERDLMRAVKLRFDPEDKCNPGLLI